MLLSNLDTFFSRLRGADYAHLLLEPVPFFGLLFGLIFFAVGLWGGEQKTRVVALVVIGLSCLSVMPYNKYRNIAQPRVMNVITQKKIYKDQTDYRKETRWVYYSLAILAGLAAVASGKLGNVAGYGVLAGGIGVLLFSGWMHMREAEIFHPNIRTVPSRTYTPPPQNRQPVQSRPVQSRPVQPLQPTNSRGPATAPPPHVRSSNPRPSSPPTPTATGNRGLSLDQPPKEAALPANRPVARNDRVYVP